MVSSNELKKFQWDHGNERKNAEKHDVSKEEVEQTFFNQPLLLLEDKAHSQDEQRFHALGKTNSNKKLHITFTMRGKFIRVISARSMSKKERGFYEKANSKI
ncbi:MAG: BrnT family toxin [Desulfobacterales bacterium]|nr:BrnT family toxin [Desulfobacterales bacterium]